VRQPTEVEAMVDRRLMLVCALTSIAAALAGCAGTPLTSDDQAEKAFYRLQECQQLQERLANPGLTPTQTADISGKMTKAGCTQLAPFGQ
jgi:hypothetical protein